MSDNSDKQEHGQNRQLAMEEILSSCVNANLISSYCTKVQKWGEPGFNPKQFYAQFVIAFPNNEEWIIYSSTSPRDRIKAVYWDCCNIKRLDSNVKCAVFVYPSGCIEEDKFQRIRRDFETNKIYCDLDYFISSNELFNLIQDYAHKNLGDGAKRGREGNNFEKDIASILSSSSNLKFFLTRDPLIVVNRFDLYETTLTKLLETEKLDISSIMSMVATTNIPRLSSGGKAKTDVLLTIYNSDGTQKRITISCKKTNKDWISVHEYDYHAFVNVLNPLDIKLSSLLEEFQKCGNLSGFGEENCKSLEEALTPYLDKLNLWVIGGNGGDGNPSTQWAKYLLCYNNNSNVTSFISVNEYLDLLKKNNVKGNFGTFFHWTYPSKRKGKRIQLKAKIIS